MFLHLTFQFLLQLESYVTHIFRILTIFSLRHCCKMHKNSMYSCCEKKNHTKTKLQLWKGQASKFVVTN